MRGKIGNKMKKLIDQFPGLMTTDEVAEYLRISKASIYHLVKGKSIPVSKIERLASLKFRTKVL